MLGFSRRKQRMLCLTLVWIANLFVCLSWAEDPPVPFHPAGEGIRLENVSFNVAGSGTFVCPDDTGAMFTCDIHGASWSFAYPWQDRGPGTAALLELLRKAGGRILSQSDSEMMAQLKASEDSTLWMQFVLYDDACACTFVQERVLRPEKTLRFNLQEEGVNGFTFYTEHDGTRFQHMDLVCDAGDLELKGQWSRKSGQLRHAIDYSHTCYRHHGPKHERFDIPQYKGRYLWTVYLRHDYGNGVIPVSVSLKADHALPELPEGEKIGGLLLKNVPYGAARAVPEFGGYYEYPGFSEASMAGDRNPTGEAVFWLPPGLWTLRVDSLAQENIAFLETHMVPVHPGRMTIVTWPDSLAEAFAGEETGRLEILKTRVAGDRVSVDIALVGTERKGVTPSVDNTTVTESGAAARVLSVSRLQTPLEVVLLLDSSGSMKGQMRAALDAASRFVKGLPADTRIMVIDFDTRPRVLPGKTKKELLRALKQVRADGATALYDSIIQGLGLLRGANRPALIVFTDGVDANFNDTGPGSKATKAEVLAGVQETDVPVFTIGFGKKSDVDTLSRIASLSGGSYERALDLKELSAVFDRISKNLGSHFHLVCERPRQSRAGDQPVISIVVDNSGSMDMSPETSGSDYRIEKVRQTLRRFVSDLPDDFLAQVVSFSDTCRVRQVTTRDKTLLLRAVSQMEGEGGTNIIDSVRTALNILKAVPSTRRYLVYLADAALKVDDEMQEEFNVVLGQLKDARISCLWIGMLDQDVDGAFAHAAQRTGGRYVITARTDQVAGVFEELTTRILGAASDTGRSMLRVAVSHRSPEGENTIFSSAEEVALPRPTDSAGQASPEAVDCRPGPPLRPYDPELVRLVSGDDLMLRDVRVTKRLALDLEARNKAVRMHLKEALFLSRLRGIDAPDGQRYMVLTLSLENILPRQKVAVYPDGSNHPAAWVAQGREPLRIEERVPTYLIPDLRRHLFLRWNNGRSFPVSELTWLAAEPLLLPGAPELAVEAGAPVSGTLIFLVPSGPMRQCSLHLYDINYGHLDIPVSGTMQIKKETIETLPKQAPVQLSETFAFGVTNTRDTDRIGTVGAGQGCVFRIVEGNFSSRIQAHLDIRPAERFRLRLPTDKGSLFLHLHPLTDRLPLGFYRPTLITPGSRNPVRLVFRLPRSLAKSDAKGEVVIDVRGMSVAVPLAEQPPPDALPGPADVSGKEVALIIHRAGPAGDIDDVGSRLVAVEATIQDLPDDAHTQVGDLIVLKNKNFDPAKAVEREAQLERLIRAAATLPTRSLGNFAAGGALLVPGLLEPAAAQPFLLFGMDSDSVVPDGHTRRGLFFFVLPEDTQPTDWAVGSLLFKDLAKPVTAKPLHDPVLLTRRLFLEEAQGQSFWDAVQEAVQRLMVLRRNSGYVKPGAARSKRVDLHGSPDIGAHVPAPSITAGGHRAFSKIKDLPGLKKQLESCRWLPSKGLAWQQQYCPEAVLTQGWGTESDFARMAEAVLNRNNIRSLRVAVDVTDAGRKALARMAGLSAVAKNQCPALWYRDKDGAERILVAPFMKDASRLKGLVTYNPDQSEIDDSSASASISVRLLVQPRGKSRQQQTAAVVDALAGGDAEAIAVDVLNASIKLFELSRDALDLGYTKAIHNGRIVYKAVLDGPGGRVTTDPEDGVDAGDFTVVGEIIEIHTDYQTNKRRRLLDGEMQITDVFHTLGINLPDLPKDSRTALEAARKQGRKGVVDQPDALSALRWHHRAILTRFIAAQSAHEADLTRTLGLVTGRTAQGRCLMVTTVKAEGPGARHTTMDLLQPFNEIHRADDERARRAFNILAGLAAARFEARAVSEHGQGLFEIWETCPQGTQLIAVDNENLGGFLDQLKARQYPQAMIERFAETEKILLFPSRPAMVQGRPRWAWIEIDPRTYQTVSVLDTWAHGAMVENFIGNLYDQATSYFVGGLVGIDASIWAVAAYSLELQDYQQILRKAEKFAQDLGKRFSVGGKSVGLAVGGKPSVSFGRAVKFDLSPKGVTMTNNLLGFGNGYKDGVAYYFQQAQ